MGLYVLLSEAALTAVLGISRPGLPRRLISLAPRQVRVSRTKETDTVRCLLDFKASPNLHFCACMLVAIRIRKSCCLPLPARGGPHRSCANCSPPLRCPSLVPFELNDNLIDPAPEPPGPRACLFLSRSETGSRLRFMAFSSGLCLASACAWL